MTLVTARRIAEIVSRLDALNAELGKLGARPEQARRVSARVKENLAFARALRGLPSTKRKQLVKVARETSPQAVVEQLAAQ